MARLLGAILASLALFFAVVHVQGLSVKDWGIEPVGQPSERSHRSTYINSWAVKIKGGERVADKVARRYGFHNLGLVDGFRNVYHFRFGGLGNIRSDVPYHSSVAEDKAVGFAEQQIREKLVSKSYVVPQDPLFAEQFHLLNTGQLGSEFIGNDLKVEPAWLQGLTGCNITVTVVDDGLDFRHPDLWPNFAPSASYDVVGNDTDPSNYFVSHGTSCGGVIASAQDDMTCGVGVAHQSNLGGVRLLTSFGNTDMEKAAALSYGRDIIDVYSNSWGPPDSGYHAMKPGTLSTLALKQGVNEGRDGKGSIYVWANGNGGDEDDCGADGYASSIYTISVGAIGVDSEYSWFDERCSAKLVTAYVTDAEYGDSRVVTTTTGGQCTEYFGGTSSATPMVAGAIALALETNPDLTWRDIQYLIVYTANPSLTNNTDPIFNGAGLVVSHQYGFGVMDAEAMVTRARHWINVPPQLKHVVTDISRQRNPAATYSARVTYSGSIRYLEHVVVKMSVNIPENSFSINRGDLEITLTSPSGTVSVLLQPRPYDDLPNEYADWSFMSVMFWGERPRGRWTLDIKTRDILSVANVSNVEFIFYGVSSVPEAVANIPDQCHSDCRRGCAKEGSNFCDSCVNFRNAHTLECITDCPAGYTNRSSYCYNESLPLKECNSTLKSKEGTGLTPDYESIGCVTVGYSECCYNEDCSALPSSSPFHCFCDDVCFKFGDCCSDIDDIGCTDVNVTQTFPYIELGVTTGVETHIVDPDEYPPAQIDVQFPFIHSIEPSITVSQDGLFLIRENFSDYTEDFNAVGVFFSSINQSSGLVSYEVHQGPGSQEILSHVNEIIHVHENTTFNGTWLLLAKWEDVQQQYYGNNTNTFQGMIITDFVTSYAVMTYYCGDLSYSEPGVVGYVSNEYGVVITHGATHRRNTHDIACFNMPHSPWMNVVYKMSRGENECEINNGGCEQKCTDTFLSFNCSCEDGYVLNPDEYSCSDINECLGPEHGCDHDCNNTIGSYTCSCRTGFVLNADGHSCDDIDECLGSDHGCEVRCENTIGSYVCSCEEGYILDSDERSCIDDPECSGSDHGCEHLCIETIGSYLCNCTEGYELNENQRTCDDIDECLLSIDDCEQTCENTDGSYVCHCGEGYMLNEDGRTCKDIDECMGSDHGCEHMCMNTIGSYVCNCTKGYELNTDGRTCRDVDECKTSMHECAQNCLNTEGSYLCSCRDSYVLNEDGLNCDVSCSGTFTDLFGFFNTPDWPDSYPSVDFSCVWEIVIDIPDASIVIQFNEPYGIHGSEPCESDYVEVLHGVGSNTTSLGKNCGTDVPGNIAVESNRATVVFRGSVSSLMDKPGVSISYKAVVEDLPFISLAVVGTPTRLPNVDDGVSDAIAVTNGFPLGCRHKPVVYVGTNGYFTFSRFTGFTPLTFSQGTGLSLVAPFFTDIDISKGHGSIAYVVNNLNSNTSRGLAQLVNTVINTNKLTNFNAQWLLIASWDDVTPYGNYRTKTSFQAILATDFIRSFAIFIYNCEEGKSRFSNHATIGYVTRDGFYENHVASSRNNPISYVSCLNDPTSEWTNVIYEVSGGGQCKR